MEESMKRKRTTSMCAKVDGGRDISQVTTPVEWDKVGGKKISFQQAIYTIPHMKDVDLRKWHDRTVDAMGDKLDSFTIAKEKHEDEEWDHIHWWLKFSKRFTCYPTTFDRSLEKHGNLSVMKKGNVKNHQFHMIRYVTKGGEFIDWPLDWDSQTWMAENSSYGRKKTKRDDIATKIMEGDYSEPYSIAKEEPGYFMEKSRQVQEFMEYIKESRDAEKKKNMEWKMIPESEEWGIGWLRIIRWLNFVIRRPEHQIGRPRHLYIHGNTRLGKTTRLIDPLKERLNCYMITKDDVQNMPWRDDYDLCIIDDFKGQKSVIWMNEFLGAKDMLIRIPGGTHMRKTRIVPTIVISNFTLEKSYPDYSADDESFKALKDRFIDIDLDRQGNPFGVSDIDEKVAEEMMEYILRGSDPMYIQEEEYEMDEGGVSIDPTQDKEKEKEVEKRDK